MSGGEVTGQSGYRNPWDWYCDAGWETEKLIYTPIGLEMINEQRDVAILDPCCGRGAILKELFAHGFEVYGSDVEDRGCPKEFFIGKYNFLNSDYCLRRNGNFSMIFNPPYMNQDDYKMRRLIERFVDHALQIATHKVCALVPLKWLSSEIRYDFFNKTPPRIIYVLSERPSMPPGEQLKELGEKAFKNGKIDYMWVVWDNQNPTASGDTKIDWIQPRERWEKEESHEALIAEIANAD